MKNEQLLYEEKVAMLRQISDELTAMQGEMPDVRPTITMPTDVVGIFQPILGHLQREELWVAVLDTRNHLIHHEMLYRGSVNTSQVRVAEVLRPAVIRDAPAMILAHNHPSGDPSPSPNDKTMTRIIVEGARLMDIELLDHLIICQGRHASMMERVSSLWH